MGHKARILNHLKEHGSITSWEAISHYGCTRLSGYIYLLKKDGHIINAVDEKSVNRYGDKVHFTRYVLKDDDNGK